MENWSTIEISVRQLVKHLIEPTVTRVLDCKDQIDKLNKIQGEAKIKTEGNSIRIDQMQQRLELVDSFSSRQVEFSASLSSFESKLERDRLSNRSKLEEVMDNFTKIRDDIQVLEHQREQMRSEVSKTNFMISQAKGFVEEKIREFKDDQYTIDMHLNSEHEKAVNSIAGLSIRLSQLSDHLSVVDLHSKKSATLSEKNKSALKSLNKHFKHLQKDFDKKIEIIQHSTVNSTAYAKESIKQMNLFIQNELPVITSLDSSDLLHCAISELKDLKKLSKAEIAMFAKWQSLELPTPIEQRLEKAKERSHEILDREIVIVPLAVPQISQAKLRNYTAKETTKEILAAEEDISEEMGEKRPPDEVSDVIKDTEIHQKQIKLEKNIQDIIIREQMNQERMNEIDENIAAVTNNIQNIQTKIFKIKKYAEELELKINNNKNDISTVKANINKQIEDLSDDMKDTVTHIHETHKALDTRIQEIDSKLEKSEEKHHSRYKDFEKLQESYKEVYDLVGKNSLDMKTAIEGCLSEYKAQSGQRRREMSDVQTEFKKNRSEYNSLLETTAAMNQEIEKVQKSITAIHESLKIQTTLELHDEHDKSSISLLGISEKSKTSKFRGKPSINVDKQCGTCAYPNLTAKNAFKMACLAYTPSSVVYNKTSYTRKELIEAKQRILSNVENPNSTGAVLEAVRQHRPQTSVGHYTRNRYSMSPASTAMISQSPDEKPKLFKK